MQIVTDRGCDISAEQMDGLNIHFAPMRLTLNGKTYSSGEDLSSEQFYDLLETTDDLPVTSQATAGDFANIYRELAKTDPEIFSIHISSGLSGTYHSAMAGAEMVPEAHVTHWDTMTLSCPEAWQVETAARAIKAGWKLTDLMALLNRMRAAAEGIYIVEDLKYLIHGGRISHIQGLLASLLKIRPVIGVGKEDGKYYTIAKERTTRKAIEKMAQSVTRFYPEGSELRTQLLHGKNFEAITLLKEEMDKLFKCTWLPTMRVGPILGAHTGGSLAGMSIGPLSMFKEVN